MPEAYFWKLMFYFHEDDHYSSGLSLTFETNWRYRFDKRRSFVKYSRLFFTTRVSIMVTRTSHIFTHIFPGEYILTLELLVSNEKNMGYHFDTKISQSERKS